MVEVTGYVRRAKPSSVIMNATTGRDYMRCEIIAVGTELLLGQIVDTNSSWMGEHLAVAGIDSHFQTKVGDNLERIVSSM